MKAKDKKAKIRPCRPEDVSFIVGSWLSNYYHQAPHIRRWIDMEVFYSLYRRRIEKKIAEAPPIVACNTHDDDQIFGWMCAEIMAPKPGQNPIPVIHYLFVKRPFRGWGIARQLAEGFDAPIVVTHWTKTSEAFGPALLYKPSLFKLRG